MDGLLPTFLIIIKKLEENNIHYMIVGSIASMLYGEPRMTHDLDLVIQISPSDASKLERIFGPDEFYCPPLEVLSSEIIHRGQFNLIHHESGLKIDIIIQKNTPHGREEFVRRSQKAFWSGIDVYVASPEDVMIKKLEYFRLGGSEKHLKDIRGILAQTPIDSAYVAKWVEQLGLQAEWKQVEA